MDQMHKSKKKKFWNQQNYYMIKKESLKLKMQVYNQNFRQKTKWLKSNKADFSTASACIPFPWQPCPASHLSTPVGSLPWNSQPQVTRTKDQLGIRCRTCLINPSYHAMNGIKLELLHPNYWGHAFFSVYWSHYQYIYLTLRKLLKLGRQDCT